jgi:hypothetical protein
LLSKFLQTADEDLRPAGSWHTINLNIPPVRNWQCKTAWNLPVPEMAIYESIYSDDSIDTSKMGVDNADYVALLQGAPAPTFISTDRAMMDAEQDQLQAQGQSGGDFAGQSVELKGAPAKVRPFVGLDKQQSGVARHESKPIDKLQLGACYLCSSTSKASQSEGGLHSSPEFRSLAALPSSLIEHLHSQYLLLVSGQEGKGGLQASISSLASRILQRKDLRGQSETAQASTTVRCTNLYLKLSFCI